MLGFQHAADALLLLQQAARHSWFVHMDMLFLGAGGAADGMVLLGGQQRVTPRISAFYS
jgi:hypothetical protein